MSVPTILLVEDDRDILQIVKLYLERDGRYRVVAVCDGSAALEAAGRETPDLILLDVMLPGMDGLSVCRGIREKSDVPVFFISARRESEDVIHGLELGADDYIVKPFDPNVLAAKVDAFFRRRSIRSKYLWKDDRLEIEEDSLIVRLDGETVPLYAKERQLLVFMSRTPKQVYSVRQLFEEVWGWDRDSDERTVMVHIRNLRKKIEPDPANPKYIVTVKGFGYRFGGEEA